MKKCPNCGENNFNNAILCGNCGYNFKTHKPSKYISTKNKNNNGNGCLIWILIIIAVICFGAFKGCSNNESTPNPVTPKSKAEYEGKFITNNIHKKYPNITVYKVTGNRAGHTSIYTNFDTTEETKVNSIWNNIYDYSGNSKVDSDEVTLNLYGKVNGDTILLASSDPEMNADNIVTYGAEISDNSDDD